MEAPEKIRDWLKLVLGGLVSSPDSIVIDIKSDEQGVLFIVKVDENDRGKVIGKKGSIAEALRVITRSAGRLIDIRTSMKIEAPGSRFAPID